MCKYFYINITKLCPFAEFSIDNTIGFWKELLHILLT